MQMDSNPDGDGSAGSEIRRPDGNGCCQLVASGGRSDDPLYRSGASEGIRTLDIHLGKVTLYQTELRSLPTRPAYTTKFALERKT